MTSSPRINKLSVRASYLLLALAESVGMLSCVVFGLTLSNTNYNESFVSHLWCMECITFVLVVSLSMAAMGLYHARLRGETSELIARIFLSFVLASVAQAVLFYLIPHLHIDAMALATALTLSLVIVCVLRYGFARVNSSDLLKRNVLIVGSGEKANFIELRMRRQSDRKGFQILGYIALPGDKNGVDDTKCIDLNMTRLEEYVQTHDVEELVIAPDQRRGTLPMEALYHCRLAGVRVTDITTFIERECSKIPLKLLQPSWMIYSDGYQASNYFVRLAKRFFDVGASLILLLLIWPLMLFTMLLILLEGGPNAPVFYTQRRVGRGGKIFQIYKFRSMCVNAEKQGAVWARNNDQRITAVGAFIRKYRIDELPQIFNILMGDMSFVGPRPERPEFVDDLSQKIPYYGDRHQVKPGLTGWAQICYAYGASETDALEKLQYDLYYIKHFSVLLDTIILVETLEVVLFGKGAR